MVKKQVILSSTITSPEMYQKTFLPLPSLLTLYRYRLPYFRVMNSSLAPYHTCLKLQRDLTLRDGTEIGHSIIHYSFPEESTVKVFLSATPPNLVHTLSLLHQGQKIIRFSVTDPPKFVVKSNTEVWCGWSPYNLKQQYASSFAAAIVEAEISGSSFSYIFMTP